MRRQADCRACCVGYGPHGLMQLRVSCRLGKAAHGLQRQGCARGKRNFRDDVEQPLARVAMIGAGVGEAMPGKNEQVGVAAGFGDPGCAFPAAGLGRDREARAGRRRGVAVEIRAMPALPRGGLLDLHAKASGAVDEIERRPVAAAVLPLRFERHGDDLLDHLAADAVAKNGGAEEAASEAPNQRIIGQPGLYPRNPSLLSGSKKLLNYVAALLSAHAIIRRL